MVNQGQQQKSMSDLQKQKIASDAIVYTADKNAESKEILKQMGINDNAPKQQTKTDAQLQVLQGKADIENEHALTD
jgi:hypothetical protein